jgi:hypothetical protein
MQLREIRDESRLYVSRIALRSIRAMVLVIQAPDNIAADADRLIGEFAAQTANPPVAAQPVIGHAVSVRG